MPSEADPHEDKRGTDVGAKRVSKKREVVTFQQRQFFQKKKKREREGRAPDTHGPRMRNDSGRENGAFYGFIMRMVDQRGIPETRDCNTWLPVCPPLSRDQTRRAKCLCARARG